MGSGIFQRQGVFYRVHISNAQNERDDGTGGRTSGVGHYLLTSGEIYNVGHYQKIRGITLGVNDFQLVFQSLFDFSIGVVVAEHF